jgi:hypothetical protein
MRRIRVAAKEIGKILLLLIIPVSLIFKFKWDSILPIIIYLQLLLIEIQAEISFRQNTLFSMQFEPFFEIEIVEQESSPKNGKKINIFPKILIRNVSKNPTYNIMVARVMDNQNKPMAPSQWKNKVRSNFISILAPDNKMTLCNFKNLDIKKEFIENELSLEVSYSTQLREWQELSIKFLKNGKFFLLHPLIKKPGILLNIFENVDLIYKYIKYSKIKTNFKKSNKI